MKRVSSLVRYFSVGERVLWTASVLLIVLSFCLFDRENVPALCASLIGVTSLIFTAKGNPAGQVLMLFFSLLYGWISFTFAYYGEMLTYLGMTAPMAVVGLVAWLRHPYNGNKSEVRVGRLTARDVVWMLLLTVAVTVLFYFLLGACGTANLLPSTLSVATSFAAAYLTYKRSAYYALAYAANDAVLIVLWGMATAADRSYVSVVVCFLMFLINDLYGFISWRRMHRRQQAAP